jgi:hypothetical protein
MHENNAIVQVPVGLQPSASRPALEGENLELEAPQDKLDGPGHFSGVPCRV